MKLSKKLVNGIFGVALSILLILSVITFQRISIFQSYANIVSHSLSVQNDILAMRSSYRSLIANQRSYLLTKEQVYFENFQEEKDSLRHTVDHFAKLTKSNKTHQNYLKRIEENVNNRIQSLLVEIINDSSSAQYKYSQKELIARNTELNQDFTLTVNALYNYEHQLMLRQMEIKENQERLTPFLMLLTALIAVGIIGYSFVMLGSELKTREATELLLNENIANLNRSNKELEQYAYVASHDLQEPLRKIRTFSDELLHKYRDIMPEDGQLMLNRIDKSASKMTLLINDLLTLSRLLSDKTGFKKIDLNNLLADELDSFSELIDEKKITIESSVLPTILCSEGQIRQLFQNLLSNAFKFLREGVKPRVVINYKVIKRWESEEEYAYHQITVRDNGLGFDNSYKEKMFTIFGRLGNTQHIQGTGIGLSICKRIMENHNGSIEATGVLNEGSIFTILFPFNANET
jgi:signal transduction histidine kinase